MPHVLQCLFFRFCFFLLAGFLLFFKIQEPLDVIFCRSKVRHLLLRFSIFPVSLLLLGKEFRELFANPLKWTGRGKGVDAAALTTPCAYTNAAGEVLLYREGRSSLRPHQAATSAAPLSGRGKVPLVLFLHGAGERGNDNAKQLKHAVGPILDFFARKGEPVCLLAPQCPEGRKWVEVDWSAPSHVMPAQPSDPLRLALELVDKTIREQDIDPARVYVTGLSMGGFGTWDALCRRPELFAAGMPVCGGGDTQQVARFRTVPVYAVHGGADKVVPTARSRAMVSALWGVGGRVLYTEYPGCGHNSWGPAFSDDALLTRFFSHTR